MPVLESVTVAEAASALGIGRAGVRRMIASGQLPAVRIGRAWRILVEDVNRLLRPANSPSSAPGSPSAGQAETLSSAIQPPPETMSAPTPPRPPEPFSPGDLAEIERYRRQLADPDPEVQRHARFQLQMFAEAAAADPTAAIQRAAKQAGDQQTSTLIW